MSSRLWYPQLDVCDAIRRFGLLLRNFDAALGLERLYIADFYLGTPSLLHKATMKMEVRREFQSLEILTPDKSFISYPDVPLFFHKMESVQKQALFEIRGRGLLLEDELEHGNVVLSELGRATFNSEGFIYTEEEKVVSQFLTKTFLAIGNVEQQEFRSRTGLRRPS
jgi:hypothetical protein